MVIYQVKVFKDRTEWYFNGRLHREDGLPASERSNGTKMWFHNGQLHREDDLPAIVHGNGAKFWFHNGQLHRENGLPACEYANGDTYWYFNGKEFSKEEAMKHKVHETTDPEKNGQVEVIKEAMKDLEITVVVKLK